MLSKPQKKHCSGKGKQFKANSQAADEAVGETGEETADTAREAAEDGREGGAGGAEDGRDAAVAADAEATGAATESVQKPSRRGDL